MSKSLRFIFTLLCFAVYVNSHAKTLITMSLTSPEHNGYIVGHIIAKDTKYGLLLTPVLHGLSPGVHGFHIHEKPSCADHGKAAGGHLDPPDTNKHLGPYDNNGHLGDLPVLIIDSRGHATLPVLAPRLKEADIKNRAIMIHANGDNYYDQPKKLGGGGARLACGVIKIRN